MGAKVFSNGVVSKRVRDENPELTSDNGPYIIRPAKYCSFNVSFRPSLSIFTARGR